MTTRHVYIRLSSIGMALAMGVACTSNATAQQVSRTWFPTPAPMTQYYTYHYAPQTCPGGACPTYQPQSSSCPNGACPTRTWAPTAGPVDSIRNGVQRVLSPVMPSPQFAPRQSPANAPSANRESPYYDYQAPATRTSSPSRPAMIAPANNDSPYYP